ncbi:hypothetical protein PLICRDRAFT_444120 [Plicaturopsis crispa FD-325 SS-3]|uniref:Mixed lineage kinase domain-containing protein n=1 Tax=Plicaturopsis crispa FD-325 SS-3 TaxID=944288 RepID=A0A0C9SQJ8_PLICR|nr:hypothetical protein PLICRDRAFT_444120 [Plicaturopsis crispa FD-325 SS-3]
MPLTFIRKKSLKPKDALHVAHTVTSIVHELTGMMSFPPASAAVSILLLIFETIQSLQANKEGCLRIARRAARILLDIKDHMNGRWASAPPRLVKNLRTFQDTLSEIYQFMRAEAESKWQSRLMRQTSINESLANFNAALDDASQSFQIATLIDIHYAIGSQPSSVETSDLKAKAVGSGVTDSSEVSTLVVRTMEKNASPVNDSQDLKLALQDTQTRTVRSISSEPQPCEELDYLLSGTLSSVSLDEDHGFRRYHSSEVRLRGRSRLKDDWWSGAVEGHVNGQKSLIKKYDGPREQAAKEWLRDVKVLSNIFHPNMPQMVGYSDEQTPTPFIVLANVDTKSPRAMILETLRSGTLASSAELLLRFYRDIHDATSYTQRQLGLSDSQMQDFVQDARFRIDGEKNLILGLPPPKEGQWHTYRNYNLTYSLVNACLNLLPNNGKTLESDNDEVTKDMRDKINHLLALVRGILPAESEPPALSERAQSLLEAADDGMCLTVAAMRASSLNAKAHAHTWSERSVPANKFAIGDLGYIPQGKGFESFVLLRNVVKDGLVVFDLTQEAYGTQWTWKNMPTSRQALEGYDLPGDVKGWAIGVTADTQIDSQIIHEASVVSPTDAWRFLLRKGQALAAEAQVLPHQLILVTRVGVNQNFYIRQFGTIPGQPPSFHRPHHAPQSSFGRPAFNHHPWQHPPPPAIFYLFTSLDPAHEPYYSDTPMCAPKGAPRPELKKGYISQIGWAHGFLNYVQLHEEDFMP